VFVGRNGSVEAEKDCSEVGFRPFVGIWFELRLDVDHESRADCGEQTSLNIINTRQRAKRQQNLTKMRVVLRSSLYFFMYSVSYSVASRLYMV